jgi:cobalamin biosynthesis protein CobD/CbiB
MDAPEHDPQPAVPVLSYQNTHDQPRPPSLGRVIGGAMLCLILILTALVFFWVLAAIIALSSSDSANAFVLFLIAVLQLYAMRRMFRTIRRLLSAQPPRGNNAS